jgi:hypothetical protein
VTSVDGDAGQPWAPGHLLRLSLAGPIELEEDLLGDVFSLMRICEQDSAQPQDSPVMRVVEALVVSFLKRIRIHAYDPFILYRY